MILVSGNHIHKHVPEQELSNCLCIIGTVSEDGLQGVVDNLEPKVHYNMHYRCICAPGFLAVQWG